jgi:hypothetical protein
MDHGGSDPNRRNNFGMLGNLVLELKFARNMRDKD